MARRRKNDLSPEAIVFIVVATILGAIWACLVWLYETVMTFMESLGLDRTASITLFVSGIAILGIFYGLARSGARNREKSRVSQITRAALEEIEKQAKNLQIRKMQTSHKDSYGSLVSIGWEKEKEYFVSTRLAVIFQDIRSEKTGRWRLRSARSLLSR